MVKTTQSVRATTGPSSCTGSVRCSTTSNAVMSFEAPSAVVLKVRREDGCRKLAVLPEIVVTVAHRLSEDTVPTSPVEDEALAGLCNMPMRSSGVISMW